MEFDIINGSKGGQSIWKLEKDEGAQRITIEGQLVPTPFQQQQHQQGTSVIENEFSEFGNDAGRNMGMLDTITNKPLVNGNVSPSKTQYIDRELFNPRSSLPPHPSTFVPRSSFLPPTPSFQSAELEDGKDVVAFIRSSTQSDYIDQVYGDPLANSVPFSSRRSLPSNPNLMDTMSSAEFDLPSFARRMPSLPNVVKVDDPFEGEYLRLLMNDGADIVEYLRKNSYTYDVYGSGTGDDNVNNEKILSSREAIAREDDGTDDALAEAWEKSLNGTASSSSETAADKQKNTAINKSFDVDKAIEEFEVAMKKVRGANGVVEERDVVELRDAVGRLKFIKSRL